MTNPIVSSHAVSVQTEVLNGDIEALRLRLIMYHSLSLKLQSHHPIEVERPTATSLEELRSITSTTYASQSEENEVLSEQLAQYRVDNDRLRDTIRVLEARVVDLSGIIESLG
jgi:hypothetical protein